MVNQTESIYRYTAVLPTIRNVADRAEKQTCFIADNFERELNLGTLKRFFSIPLELFTIAYKRCCIAFDTARKHKFFHGKASIKLILKEGKMKQFFILCLFLALGACATTSQPVTQRNSQLTQGNVQMNLIVGKTTKTEVLENFGAPNITTRDGSGKEVWTYQRAAQINQSSSQSGYWTIIFGGQSSNSTGFESSSQMITLIIKFDKNDVVTDFRSRTSNF